MLQDAHLLTKIGFDKAENEPSTIWQILVELPAALDVAVASEQPGASPFREQDLGAKRWPG